MDLTPPRRYAVRNAWGRGVVDSDEAIRVFLTWPEERRRGSLHDGFTVWEESELGGKLVETEYQPIQQGEA